MGNSEDEVSVEAISEVIRVANAVKAAKKDFDTASIADASTVASDAELGNDPGSDADAALALASKEGFPARGAIGSMFGRDKDGAKSQAYIALPTRDAKAEFRKKWAKLRLEKNNLTKQRTDTLSHTETGLGRYRSIRWLINEEGIEAAKEYVASCEEKGGKWTHEDQMWKQTRYWVLEQTETVTQDKTLSLTATSSTADSSIAAPPHTEPPPPAARALEPPAVPPAIPPAVPEQGANADAPPASPKRKKNKQGEKEDNGNQSATKKAKGNKGAKEGKLLKSSEVAAKVKVSVTKALAEASNLTKVIQANPAWEWARNQGVLSAIDRAQDSINQIMSEDTFAQVYMTMDSKHVQKKHPNDFENQCGRFNTLLKAKAATLSQETAVILDMHVARVKKIDNKENADNKK